MDISTVVVNCLPSHVRESFVSNQEQPSGQLLLTHPAVWSHELNKHIHNNIMKHELQQQKAPHHGYHHSSFGFNTNVDNAATGGVVAAGAAEAAGATGAAVGAAGLLAGLMAFLWVVLVLVLPLLIWVGAIYLSISCYKGNTGAQIGAFIFAFFLPIFYLIFYLIYHVVAGNKCAK